MKRWVDWAVVTIIVINERHALRNKENVFLLSLHVARFPSFILRVAALNVLLIHGTARVSSLRQINITRLRSSPSPIHFVLVTATLVPRVIIIHYNKRIAMHLRYHSIPAAAAWL